MSHAVHTGRPYRVLEKDNVWGGEDDAEIELPSLETQLKETRRFDDPILAGGSDEGRRRLFLQEVLISLGILDSGFVGSE
jgi:hypothetical protein